MVLLDVKNLRKSFGKIEVLKGVSFTLDEGEVLSIIGSSGSGKTTILRCINQLEIPNSGYISVDGIVYTANYCMDDDAFYDFLSGVLGVHVTELTKVW